MVLTDKDIIIERSKLRELPLIGHGDEGLVFNYHDKYAIKIFKDLYDEHYIKSRAKTKIRFLKLKEMMKESDSNLSLPLGFVSFDGENIVGIYSKLVKHKDLIDFDSLSKIKSADERARYLLMGDSILQRIHSKGFIVGDIKPDNILINDADDVVYIDCDNYKYKNYLFDTIPTRAGFFYRLYDNSISYQDNDKLVYTVMALNILTGDKDFNLRQNHEGLRRAIRRLHLSDDIEDYLKVIVSPSLDKPYVGPAIEKMLIKK